MYLLVPGHNKTPRLLIGFCYALSRHISRALGTTLPLSIVIKG